MAQEIKDLKKLCIHTMTNKPWSLDECLKNYSAKGIGGISVWRNVIENQNLNDVNRRILDSGITPVSLVRGGFFTGKTVKERQDAIDENKRCIDEASAIGTDLVVLVCGSTPGFTIDENVKMIEDGINQVTEHAQKNNVRLGIEPLHPMYADIRSAVSSLRTANNMAERINSPFVGVTLDVFHVWWEEQLQQEIQRCADLGKLFSFHVCDWKTDMEDMLQDRGLMGEGIINVPQIRGWIEDTGFDGFNEIEIFSKKYWDMDQNEFLDLMIDSYLKHS
ncbi:MAG: sugar phosphate isomerase/epimerase [Lentisphaeraceae bacterium]|nr:sugar phosphate isomerase/epimerase [Lentisphaeraceae bacterium]